MAKTKRSIVIHTRLAPSEYARLMAVRRKTGKTKAAVLRDALNAYFDDRIIWRERLRNEEDV